jgi:acetyl esterase/lipase
MRRRLIAIASLVVVALAATRLPSVRSAFAGRGVDVRADLAFGDDPKQRLDLFVPPSADPSLPAILFVHGGWWRGGDRSYWAPLTGLYGNAGRALADRGYLVAVTSYRLFPQVGLDVMLDDVADAARLTLAQGRSRIVLVGHSAGAHLVASLATDPARLRAHGVDPAAIAGVVGLSGVYDIAATLPLVDDALRSEVFVPLFSADAARQRAASPVFRFGPETPRALFLAGSDDYPAALRGLEDARGALAGASIETIPGNTHEDMVLEMGTSDDAVTPRIDAFARGLARVEAAPR